MSCSRTQRSDAGEARDRGPSVSSQALYHWATALPILLLQREGQALPNAREGVEDYKVSKPAPGPEVITYFSCSTQLSMEFILSINVKKCWHLNSIFKIGEFLHVNKKTFTFKLTFNFHGQLNV